VENNSFTNSLIGTTIQDGGKKKRMIRSYLLHCPRNKRNKKKIKPRKINKKKRKSKLNVRVQVYHNNNI